MNVLNERIIERLTVKITSTLAQEAGSGFLLSQPHFLDKIYVLTAKHCLCGSEFGYEPNYKSLFLEMSIGKSIIKYELQSDDKILFNVENDPDVAIVVIDRSRLVNEAEKFPMMNAVVDRRELQGCTIVGFPREFSLKSVKSIVCSFDLTADDNKIELSPESSIDTIEYGNNLTYIRGMSGGATFLENNGEIFFHGIIDTFGGWQRFKGATVKVFNDLLKENGYKEIGLTKLELDEGIVSAVSQLNATTNEEIKRRKYKNKIGELHLDRSALVKDVKLAFDNAQIVVVHGSAGVGKSVVSNEFIDQQNGSRSVFVLRSEELLGQTLIGFLTSRGISRTLEQILDSPILLTEKIIYIDAVENILEAQSFEAIESILTLSKQRQDLKILISIRSRYNDQLKALLTPTMPDKRAFVEIPFLSDEEIDTIKVSYGWIEQLFENPSLGELLRTPFYLNHTISLSDAILSGGEISKRSLIIRLWKKIVVSTNPFREEAFQRIVVDRAKAMKPFIKPTFIDNATQLMKAVADLFSDEVVVSDEDDYGDSCYAPSHDIFQDWALIRHVNDLRANIPELTEFLKELGSELAIRRGFRLWMSDQLDLKKFQSITDDFIVPTSSDWTELVYWKDEIILSILKSEHLESFVEACHEQFLDENATLFRRFVRLLMIVSQPMKTIGEKQKELFIDSQLENAWQTLIEFLSENYSDIDIEFEWIINFFNAWNSRAKIEIYGNDGNVSLNKLCKSVMLAREGSEFTDSKEDRRVLLVTFINTSIKTNTDLANLVHSAIEFEISHEEYRKKRRKNPERKDPPASSHELKSYFKDVLKMIRSGQESVGLCYLFPEKILDYVKSSWRESAPELLEEDRFSFQSDTLESEFGLSNKSEFNYFPASPYQAPILNLLRFYPIETIKSICDLFNYASEKYLKNKSKYRSDEIFKVNLSYEGVEKQLIGSSALWSIFRGTGQASPYLLQSLLMALEKYLLNLIKKRDDVSKLCLERAFEVIYKHSTNVSLFAVVASVSMAHEKPVSISKFILPLFTVKEFFYWEIRRFTNEGSALAPMGDKPLIQNERLESNKLPHRKEYLETFLTRLSLTTIMFGDILKILDKHYEERVENNDNWSLVLNRMDVRKFEFIERPSKNQIELRPKLDKALEGTVKKYEEESLGREAAMTALNWSLSIISKGNMSTNDYETWKSYFGIIQEGEKGGMFNASAGIAYIGLKFHFEAMNKSEEETCINIIIEHATKTIELDELGEPHISNSVVFNKEPVLLALPELFKSEFVEGDKLKEFIAYAVFGLDIENGVDVQIFEKLAESLWQNSPDFAKAAFRGLYAIKELKDQRPRLDYGLASEERKALLSVYADKVKKFYSDVIEFQTEGIDISSMSLDLKNLEFLNGLIHFTPNYVPLDKEQLAFLIGYTRLLQESTLVKYEGHESEHHKIKSARHVYEKKIAQILLGQPKEIAESLFFDVFDFVTDGKNKLNKRFDWNLFLFMDECLKAIIIEQDQKEGDHNSFWIVWNTLKRWQHERIPLFIGKLLLDISWKDTADKWKPIEGKGQFFIDVVEESKAAVEGYLVKLISRIGFEELGVELIPKVTSLIKENGFKHVALADLELWIQKLFSLRRKDVVSDSLVLEDVLYILNGMVDMGSSVGIHIRDVLISYDKRRV